MKWRQLVIVCAATLAFVACDSSTTRNGTPAETNLPAAQISAPEQVLDAARTAAPSTVSTSAIVPAPTPPPPSGQN